MGLWQGEDDILEVAYLSALLPRMPGKSMTLQMLWGEEEEGSR